MEYYTEKVLRYRVFTQWKDEKDTSNWSLYYSTNDMADAEDMASDVNDNEINKNDITDINIATDKRHKELEKDFKRQMKESLPKLKDLIL